ncbi:hypothetical protein [Glycomyces paridis]|uniref:Uncharacterized protein n=1 Tax=Glycomyces paridis TaxID=2126555 RepID=A0A4S8P8X7_9ACTN|nr:hypothetical protein [Glycomyces paridis]THV26035.1 hypothetical protein E9998_20105 [Glycomyces paridis]
MAYNPPPHYSFGDPSDHQPPQSVPPAYSPQPPQQPAGYVPQQTSPMYQGPPTNFAPPPVLRPTGPRRSPLVPLLSAGMVIGLAAAAVSLALWVSVRGELDDATKLADDRDAELQQVRDDLEAAEAQVEELEVAATDADSMRECLDDLNWFYSTEEDSDEEAEANEALLETCANWLW